MPGNEAVSADGTRIGYGRTGAGPTLVLVHGTTADQTRWANLLPGLEPHFTVCAVDRRGRGSSGDGPRYAIEREFEDIAAVVDALPGPVNLLGHSFGALCSLEAALRTGNLGKLVLYEPPIPTGITLYTAEQLARLEALVERDERAAVVETFFREIVRAPESEITMLRSLPNWPARVAAAHTIPREMRATEDYAFDDVRFASLATPTLFLLGGASPPFLTKATHRAHAAIPGSRLEVMAGQQHTAMNTAPELFLEKVLGFLVS